LQPNRWVFLAHEAYTSAHGKYATGRLGGTGHTCVARSNLQVKPEVCFAIP